MDLRLGSAIEKVEDGGSHVEVSLANGRHVRSEMLLFAAGRMGATDKLNVDAAGLETDHRGRLEVDRKTYQTNVPHIYATGDVIGHPSLASTSLQQGRVAACHALETPTLPESPWFPYGIYSVPEISTCGMSEEEMQERGIPYEVGIARFRETSRGHIMGLEHGMLKMLFSLKTRRVLGVQIVGEGATELDPHCAGGFEPERHGGLLRSEHLQLSHFGRGLQDCGLGRLQPHADPRRIQG